MSKDNQVFFKKVRVIFIYCLKTYTYWRSQKIIYQHICMTEIYFDRLVQFHPSMRSELYLVRQFWSEKLIFMRIQCTLYVLSADKVSCPMTQHYDSGDSQINNPLIPSLTLYELRHCASWFKHIYSYFHLHSNNTNIQFAIQS